MSIKYTISYREVATPIVEPVTKFGGQPVWMDESRWPLSRDYGTPMQFICQIALPEDLFGDIEARMAYLFLTDWNYESPFPETFDPDGGENALILQPGGTWAGPSLPLREGPSLYRRASLGGTKWKHIPCEFAVELRSGKDPETGAWDDVDPDDEPVWNAYMDALFEDKIGGTPVPTVNEPRFPDPNQWRLLLQLNTKGDEASDPFFINFASDGVGYAFISADGRAGRFMWFR